MNDGEGAHADDLASWSQAGSSGAFPFSAARGALTASYVGRESRIGERWTPGCTHSLSKQNVGQCSFLIPPRMQELCRDSEDKYDRCSHEYYGNRRLTCITRPAIGISIDESLGIEIFNVLPPMECCEYSRKKRFSSRNERTRGLTIHVYSKNIQHDNTSGGDSDAELFRASMYIVSRRETPSIENRVSLD
jgi:hypothetical protein